MPGLRAHRRGSAAGLIGTETPPPEKWRVGTILLGAGRLPAAPPSPSAGAWCLMLRPVLCLIAVCGALVASPQAHAAGDPPLINWPWLLPSLAQGYDPSSADECRSGQPSCMDEVIASQQQHLDQLGCSHNAVFALTYLRTTEELRRAFVPGAGFRDPSFLIHQDAVFAGEYARQYETWASGAPAAPAWQIAFTSADRRELPAAGNLMLALNAHIGRDLPFVLERIGLVAPDGSSRKGDHDRVNRPLNRVTAAARDEIARRLDPSIGQTNTPGYLDETLLFQFVQGLRERAWRLAEELDRVQTDAQRQLVVRRIEREAELSARALHATFRYPAGSASADKRDRYCASR